MFNTIFSEDIIVLHRNDADGICALWTFDHMIKTYPKALYGREIEYVSIDDKSEYSIPVVENKTVIILGLNFQKDILINIVNVSHWVLILGKEKVDATSYPSNKMCCEFDPQRSVGQIAWDVFMKNETRPWFIDVIAKELVLKGHDLNIRILERLWSRSLFGNR